jgi:hypothetical protein
MKISQSLLAAHGCALRERLELAELRRSVDPTRANHSAIGQ